MARRRLTSIVRQVRLSVSTIALLLILPVIAGLITTILYSHRYQSMIRRMDQAAELKPLVETTLAENMFSVAAGRTSFADSGAEKLMGRVKGTLDDLLGETSGGGHLQGHARPPDGGRGVCARRRRRRARARQRGRSPAPFHSFPVRIRRCFARGR